MGKAKKGLTPMEKLAKKASKILKNKTQQTITKQDFNTAIKKAAKPKAPATK